MVLLTIVCQINVMVARKRKGNAESSGNVGSESRESTEKVTGESTTEDLNEIIEGKSLSGKCCNLFLRTFDCVWTVVLILGVLVAIIVFCPPISSYVMSVGHSRIYYINRAMRFSFMYIQPYLLWTGVDVSQNCMVANPFANETMRCPCISQPDPIKIQLDQQPIPHKVLHDSDHFYVLRNAIAIEKDYGRQTLVEYFNRHGRLPEVCQEINRHREKGIDYRSLTNDSYWTELQSKDPLAYTWLECSLNDSIRSMLPGYLHLFEGFRETVGHYSLSTQWAKNYAIPNEDPAGTHLLIVLQGTLQIKSYVAGNCMEFCWHPNKLLTLSQGDMLLYNELYWFNSVRTWSKTAFTLTAFLKQE